MIGAYLKLEEIGLRHVQEIRRQHAIALGATRGDPSAASLFRGATCGLVPWIARYEGPRQREFLPFFRDYSRANGAGTRGVYRVYMLREQVVHEVYELLSWKRSRRYFCRAEGGQIVEMSREEVDRWLREHKPTSA